MGKKWTGESVNAKDRKGWEFLAEEATKLIDDIEVDIENDRYFASTKETIIEYAKAA